MELATKDMFSISEVKEQYKPMLREIENYLPIVLQDTKNFNKTQSQFMDNFLTVSHPTPLRNIRQLLAEINKSKLALNESYFKVEKNKIEIKKLKRRSLEETDDLEIELINLEIQEKENQIWNIQENQDGAIRKISNHIEQIKAIKQSYNIEEFSELDFEKEEEKYHIMKAFEQGLTSARSHAGIVDEGNQIYFLQIGINGALAQKYVSEFLIAEQNIINEGKIPSPNLVYNFLLQMYQVFKGVSNIVLNRKGMNANDFSVLK